MLKTQIKRVKLNYEEVNAEINILFGRIMTIIDASLPEGQQKKAIKDLLWAERSRTGDLFWNWSHPDSKGLPEREMEHLQVPNEEEIEEVEVEFKEE